MTVLTVRRVWKQVNAACVDKKEFRLAQMCGLNLIVGLYYVDLAEVVGPRGGTTCIAVTIREKWLLRRDHQPCGGRTGSGKGTHGEAIGEMGFRMS